MKNGNYPLAVRAQVVTLITYGFDIAFVEATTKVPERTIRRMVKKAKDRGYDPRVDPQLRDEYLENDKIPGRPTKQVTGATEQSINKDEASGREAPGHQPQ